MTESYDVGVLIHLLDDVGEQIKFDLTALADKWEGLSESGWPFGVALLPTGDYLRFLFQDPDNAHMFVTHAEKYLQAVENAHEFDKLYSIVIAWTGLIGGESG